MTTKKISISMPTRDYEQLKEAAARQNRTVSAQIRYFLSLHGIGVSPLQEPASDEEVSISR